MPQLDGGGSAFLMYGVREAFEGRQDLRTHPHFMTEGDPVGRHSTLGHSGHTDAAGSNFSVMLDQGFFGCGIMAHAFETTGADSAVAKL